MTDKTFHILGISGSLRRASYNTALLRAAQELADSDVEITIYQDLAEIPHYNEDVRAQGFPPAVQRLREMIAGADALLIATPEYNYGVSGPLKDAIDWASRPPETPLRHKPIALMGASMSLMGTVRAQMAMRQTLHYVEAYVLLKPEVLVAKAQDHIDENGRLHDETTRKMIAAEIRALRAWAERVSDKAAQVAS